MASVQLPIGLRELKRRRQVLRQHIGTQIRDLRVEAGITQSALAAAGGIDPAHLSRIEHGLTQPSIDVLVAIGAALGGDLGVRIFPGTGPRIKDRLQAPMIEALIRQLDPRWTATPEVAVPKVRGFIDLALGLRDGTNGVACEAQSELRSIDTVVRRALEKSDALRDLGIAGTRVSPMLLIRSTTATRNIVRTFSGTLGAAFPARVESTLAALRGGDTEWPGPAMLWARLERGVAEILDRPPRGITIGR
jgi:transcriptional regulator with XRE-family HTH domain